MPHIFDVHDLGSAQHAAVQDLKQKFGVREIPRLMKLSKYDGSTESGIFGKPLVNLRCNSIPIIVKYKEDGINVCADVSVEVPSYVIQCCHLILASPTVVGLFRKAGSSARQRDIKKQVENGVEVGEQHHVIDICNVLKQFLRDLPDPLIPSSLHELFVKCSQSEDVVTALQLCCLLLPLTHLSTLCFLMQFLSTIASHSAHNFMDELNLSTILAPTLMPLPEQKADKHSGAVYTAKMQARAKVLELMIRHSEVLCAIPECLANKIRVNNSEPEHLALGLDEEDSRGRRTENKREKRKKRRSGSFTRMIDGLRKMVTRSTGPSPAVSIEALDMTDPMATPAKDRRIAGKQSPMIKSSKRKADPEPSIHSFSSKKKKAILESLPQASVLATTPFTPQGQHVTQPGQTDYPFSSPPISLNPSPACKPTLTEAKKHKRFFTPKRQTKRSQDAEGKGTVPVESKTPKLNKRRLSLGRRSGKKSLDKVLEGADETYDTNCFRIQGKRQRAVRKRTQSGPSTYGMEHKAALVASASNLDANDNPLRTTPASEDVSDGFHSKSDDKTVSAWTAASQAQQINPNSNSVASTPTIVVSAASSHAAIQSTSSNNDSEEQYQELRTRLDAMEEELSNQLNQIKMSGKLNDSQISNPVTRLESVAHGSDTPTLVQGVYEKTLESSEKLAENINASDQLAKELKRGLKIRRSAEHRVIRSPSARKIGVIRRRSRESPRNQASPSPRLRRCQSAQLRATKSPLSSTSTPLLGLQIEKSYMRHALRRGRPNTVTSGLPTPSPMRAMDNEESSVAGSQTNLSSKQTPHRKMAHRSEDKSEKRQSMESEFETVDGLTQSNHLSKPQAKVQRNGSVLKLVRTFESGSQIGPVKDTRKSASAADLKIPITLLQPSVVLRRESTSVARLSGVGKAEVFNQPPPVPPRTHFTHTRNSPAHKIEPVPEVPQDDDEWVSADVFVRHLARLEGPTNGRPSLQKLRTENTGKVNQCVKKFDKSETKTLAKAPSTLRTTKSRFSLAPTSKLLPEATSTSPTMDLSNEMGQRRRWMSGSNGQEAANETATPPHEICLDSKFLRVSISPLRDSNKVNIVTTPMEVASDSKSGVSTPFLVTPRLKSALMNAPRGLTPAFTPRGFRARMHAEGRVGKRASPLRAVASVTSPRRSPRLHYLQTEQSSSASKNRAGKSPSAPVY